MNAINKVGPGLVHFACVDYVGIARGASFASTELGQRLERGLEWAASRLVLNPFNQSVKNICAGQADLRLMPDRCSEIFLPAQIAGISPLHYFLSDVVDIDGQPWAACPRHFLKLQMDRLAETGMTLQASFDHEFMLTDIAQPSAAYSLHAAREEEQLLSVIMQALQQVGVAPQLCLAEAAARQFKLTCSMINLLAAADRAVHLREIVREIGRQRQRALSFSPKLSNYGGSNAVLLRLSLSVQQRPAAHQPSARQGSSALDMARQFCAGLHRHLKALTAISAPAVVSYQRLKPQSGNPLYACISEQQSDAALRINFSQPERDSLAAQQIDIEYRAADALASPYLLLGAALAAGLAGVQQQLDMPALVNTELAAIPSTEYDSAGISLLPSSLHEALRLLKNDTVLAEAMGSELLRLYLAVKRSEIEALTGYGSQKICSEYQRIY